jgi:hypothetical protein
MAAHASGESWNRELWTAIMGQPAGLASSDILDGSGLPAGPPSKSFYSSSFSHPAFSKHGPFLASAAFAC